MRVSGSALPRPYSNLPASCLKARKAAIQVRRFACTCSRVTHIEQARSCDISCGECLRLCKAVAILSLTAGRRRCVSSMRQVSFVNITNNALRLYANNGFFFKGRMLYRILYTCYMNNIVYMTDDIAHMLMNDARFMYRRYNIRAVQITFCIAYIWH